MSNVEVSVVLPAYNEESTIENTVEVTLTTLASFLPEDAFEVIIAEDGCDDRTPEIADRMTAEDSRVRHFHSDERLGRGGALERAFEASTGETLVYFDTDLATDMDHLEELVESVRTEGYDIATGSRRMPGEKQDREPERGVASSGFNGLVRLFLRSDLHDHQCGFKAFDRDALLTLLADVEDNHWFWDTELLVRAQRYGYRVKEFPVRWTPKGDTKVDLVRDVFGMGSQILRVWWEFSVRPSVNRRVTLAAGSLLVVAALALMTVYLDPTAVIEAMSGADPILVAVAALVYATSWPLRGLRYRDILGELGYEGDIGFLTGAIFISQTGNLVFPARAGDAVRAYVVKARRSVPYPSGFASLAVERVFDLLTIAVLAGTVLLGFAAFGLNPSFDSASGEIVASGRTALYVAAGVGVAAVIAVGVIVASARSNTDYVRTLIERLSDDSYVEYVVEVIEMFVSDVQTVAADRGAFLRVGLSSIAIWTLDVVTAILVFQAFGTPLPLVPLIALSFFAVSVGNLAKVLPLSPGGIGLYEGAFTLLVVIFSPALAGVAIAASVALAVSVVDHAVKNVVTVIGGVASTLLYNVSLTTAVEESRSVKQTTTATTRGTQRSDEVDAEPAQE